LTTHFTIRMAWHDNKWNGKVCQDPENNFYCTGSRSLLSERLARKKNTELEARNQCKPIDQLPEYLPPCFWTSAAFSPSPHNIVHSHAFQKYEEKKKIKETLNPYSVFSWPYRLSFTHSPAMKKAAGDYPPDIPERIANLISKFEPDESVVFFYLNYDNPISGDDEKYALVGCAVVNKIPKTPGDFPFSEDELEAERRQHRSRNFQRMNWAVQISYDFENKGIVLPYHEYLEYIKKYPEERKKLEDIKVLIKEPSLVFGFKYVLADVNEDQCIYLLTKLRKAIDTIQAHKIVDFSKQQKLVNQLLEKAWMRRGLYPGLEKILEYIMDDDTETWKAKPLVQQLRANTPPEKEDLCEKTFALLLDQKQSIPTFLMAFTRDINQLRRNIRQHTATVDLLKKLSLFLLKKKQLDNIIGKNQDSFANVVEPKDIVRNPYVLCEEYLCELTADDLDKEEIADDPIDLFKIDIGMFPERFIKDNAELQDLAPGGPERLRAVIIDYLYDVGEQQGHCFVALEEVHDNILSNPLFYKREYKLNKDQLLTQSYLSHFNEKLKVIPNEGRHYFYLNEVHKAEGIVRDTVDELLKRPDDPVEITSVESFVNTQIRELKEKGVKCFDEKQFFEERTNVLRNILKKSFYVLSGKPGTGKTKILEKIIQELEARKQEVVVLAPTGKASLRLKTESKAKDAQTIDRFIYSDKHGYREILEDFSAILKKGRTQPCIKNLIIDESSMVDLQKLAALFSMLKLKGEGRIERVIMVGDENQLPPIGFGKPYYDIIQYLKVDPQYRKNNYIKLLTNCRNELDPKIIEFADIFAGKNRYYNELLDKILQEGEDISEGLALVKWADTEKLQEKIDKRLDKIINTELDTTQLSECKDRPEQINSLFGLYPNGFANPQSVGIDNFQIITPYRTERFGSLALSDFFETSYPRGHWADRFLGGMFTHADKIIRLTNEYIYDIRLRRRVLRLSNGSMGVVNNKTKQRPYYRIYYFTDQETPLFSTGYNPLKEDENFELAYAITVHKSQGSDFRNVFLVVPSKRGLLSKELLYTALTRAKRSTTVFLQEERGRQVLEEARSRSAVLERNTSLFDKPENSKEIFEPVKGKKVKSKIEYILFKALEASGLKFEYEEPLYFEKGPEKIKPDFTIYVDGKTYYWEHLGEPDLKQYWTDWIARRDWYNVNGKLDNLITTDDLGGVKQEKILALFEAFRKGEFRTTKDSELSQHHYELYD
jgi:exodeoxyribonuclease V alpha subunit